MVKIIMKDIEKLQEMAKNGEISKALLEDEEFKSDLKKIVKEETDVEISDEEIPEIIQNLEEFLKSEKVLKEAELEAVSGGAASDDAVPEGFDELTMEKDFEHYGNIRRRIALTGKIISYVGAMAASVAVGRQLDKKYSQESGKRIGTKWGSAVAFAAAGGVGSLLSMKLGDTISLALHKRELRKRARKAGFDMNAFEEKISQLQPCD